MTSYEPQRPSSSSPSEKPPINLLRGWPHPSLLPTDIIRSAAHTALSDPTISQPGLLYGPDPGYQPIRESIAKWVTDFYRHSDGGHTSKGDVVTADRIAITGGASQNLGNVLGVYTDPSYTRCVWVLAPAYFLAFRIFADAGLCMRAVPEDDEGVDIAYLRAEMEKVEKGATDAGRQDPAYKGEGRTWAKVYKHVVYCVPTFANPSSKTMTLRRRAQLVALAREMDALVVCDDVYDFLQWPTTHPSTSPSSSPQPLQTAHLPRLIDLDRTLPHPDRPYDAFGNVCSNGSFSKIAGPGIRVGWCEGTPAFAFGVSQAGTTKSGGAPSQLTSTYVNVLLERGELQAHIRDVLCPAYGRRYAKLVGAVERWLVPLGFALPKVNVAMREVAGGYFTWLTLPAELKSVEGSAKGSAAEVLAERCLMEENVTIAPGKICEVPDGRDGISFGNCIRLCWSWEDEEKLEEGIERIGRVAERMVEEGKWKEREERASERDELKKGYVLVRK